MSSLAVLIPLFLFCFAGIVTTAFWSIESIKTVSEKFKLSDSFVGAAFLSVGTSFPEFINSIVSGIIDRNRGITDNAVYSFYNVTGANVWQIVFLVVAIAFIAWVSNFKKDREEDLGKIVDIFWKDSFFSWKLVFTDTLFLFLIFILPGFFSNFIFKGFNLLGIFFLVVWLYYLKITYKEGVSNARPDRAKYFTTLSKPFLMAVTLFIWVIFGAFAYGNFYISSQFGLEKSAAFGIILSFVTSTPEFSVLIFLFKQREYRIAVGGFFGSSLFNLVLPVITNLISANTIFGKKLIDNSKYYDDEKLSFWLLLDLVLLFLFLITFWKWEKGRKYVMSFNGIVIATIYIVSNLYLSNLGT